MKLKAIAVAVASTLSLAMAGSASAQISGDVVKIGFITDISGLYSDIDGQGGAEALKTAIAACGTAATGRKIE